MTFSISSNLILDEASGLQDNDIDWTSELLTLFNGMGVIGLGNAVPTGTFPVLANNSSLLSGLPTNTTDLALVVTDGTPTEFVAYTIRRSTSIRTPTSPISSTGVQARLDLIPRAPSYLQSSWMRTRRPKRCHRCTRSSTRRLSIPTLGSLMPVTSSRSLRTW